MVGELEMMKQLRVGQETRGTLFSLNQMERMYKQRWQFFVAVDIDVRSDKAQSLCCFFG